MEKKISNVPCFGEEEDFRIKWVLTLGDADK